MVVESLERRLSSMGQRVGLWFSICCRCHSPLGPPALAARLPALVRGAWAHSLPLRLPEPAPGSRQGQHPACPVGRGARPSLPPLLPPLATTVAQCPAEVRRRNAASFPRVRGTRTFLRRCGERGGGECGRGSRNWKTRKRQLPFCFADFGRKLPMRSEVEQLMKRMAGLAKD